WARWKSWEPAPSTGGASRPWRRRWGSFRSSRSCSPSRDRGLADLSGKQRRYLRALGHHLDPVLQIGHEGLSDALVAHASAQLELRFDVGGLEVEGSLIR